MAQLQCLFACAIVLFMYIEEGYSISCYHCNSHNDSRCELDNLPETMKVNCDPAKGHILCRKIKQVIDFEVNGLKPDTRIIRSCGWYNKTLTKHCYHRSGFGGRQEVCACNEDFCNKSTKLLASSSILFLIIYAILKIYH